MRRSFFPARALLIVVAAGAGAAAQEVRVAAASADLAWFARRIGGKDAVVEAFVRGDQDPHRVSARPSHLLKLKRADLLLQSGMDLEHSWLPALLEASRNERIRPGGAGFVDASKGLAPLEVPERLDRGSGVDLHARGNPHFHLDPEGGRLIARNVAEGFARVRPRHAATYRDRLAAFEKDLDAKAATWAELAAPLKGRRFVVRHGAWTYLAARYGFVVVADLEPKPGVEPGPAHVARVLEAARRERVAAVVTPSYFDDGASRRVAETLGVPLLRLPAGATGAAPLDDWFALIEHLLRSLVDAGGGAASRPA
ncbi:MAG TPA: metal ABC transporter substrate-binding protein [Planctomycetota bacterium]|nr:metal ABC transporter substrate-binding protein [Planctomycetota bacterium]